MLDMFALNWGNNPQDTVSSIQYQPTVAAQHVAAQREVHEIVARRHGFSPDDSEAFNEWDSVQSQQMVGKIFDAMDLFLGGVGLVTLALGAVGIVNIMLVSVTERTSEIGLRKALGATKRSILVQFFLEGLTLTGFSGLIGIAGSAFFMWLLQRAMGQNMEGFDPPRLQPWSAALAIVSLAICGIVSGLYPAAQAAAMEPVEALRKE
jgi:putative ABC transport system permease protein